jgi:Flp pilus assembly protein TadG
MVEVALAFPWVLLLFMGLFNFGFYSYAAINTQHAADVAALFTSGYSGSASDAGTACGYVLAEMKYLPNLSGVTSCASYPLIVQAASCASGPCSLPGPGPACTTGVNCDTTVAVTYRSVLLFPIPGLMKQLTITRRTTMRVAPD